MLIKNATSPTKAKTLTENNAHIVQITTRLITEILLHLGAIWRPALVSVMKNV
jgi:hypothetical protein